MHSYSREVHVEVGKLMKILLAVDGSSCSDAAVEEIGRRPWPEGSSIKVLTAFEIPAPPTPEAWAIPLNYFAEMDVALRKQAQNIVDGALQTLKSRFGKSLSLDGALVPGPARTVILDEAERWGADLIVVGSHGYRAWERFLLGSVSQSVVSHAKCSVEVVRCPHAHKAAKEEAPSKKEE
jgi:nucleotide-binding universal stress UspA family protein